MAEIISARHAWFTFAEKVAVQPLKPYGALAADFNPCLIGRSAYYHRQIRITCRTKCWTFAVRANRSRRIDWKCVWWGQDR